MSVSTVVTLPVKPERTSGRIISTLVDEDGAPITLASITSLLLTLYDRASGTVINSRTNQNVLNANNVTVGAADGLVTWTVLPADMAIVRSGASLEHHIALFVVSWSGGTKSFPWQILIPVENLQKLG